MKKVIIVAFLSLSSLFMGFSQGTLSDRNCIDAPSEILVNENNIFSTDIVAQAYWWEITSGNASIVGPNTNQNVTIRPNNTLSFSIKLVYFRDGKCFTCTRSFTATQVEPPCFVPEIEGKIDCPTGGTNNFVILANASSNISEVTWVFRPSQNNNYYPGFNFINGTLLGDGTSFVTSTNLSNNFQADLIVPINDCHPTDLICFEMIITFTDNTCDGELIDIVCEEIGVPDFSLKLNVLPNPSKGKFEIQNLGNSKIKNVYIKDISGIEVQNLSDDNQMIDISNQRPGFYFALFQLENGITINKKLVIE